MRAAASGTEEERETLMARTTVTVTLKWRWWLRHYLFGVRVMSMLTCCEPNLERVSYWVGKGIKIEMR